MSGSSDEDAQGHPVRAAQLRIAEAFARPADGAADLPLSGIATLIVPLLDALGWQGTPRQIIEAMPHEASCDDVPTLRAALVHLGVETPRIRLKLGEVRSHHCPFLLVESETSAKIVTNVDETGQLRMFDPVTVSWRSAPADSLRGDIHLARLADPSRRSEELQRNGFVWPTLKAFKGRLITVFWFSLCINLLGLVVSLYVMFVYDKAIGARSLDTLAWLAIGAVAALGVEMTLRGQRAKILSWIGARFDALIASGSLRSVLNLPLSMSESAPLSAQLARFRQFEVGRELFGGSLLVAIVDLPFVLMFIALIFLIGGMLGFIPIALAALLALIGLISDPFIAKQTRDMGEWKARSDSLLVEVATRFQTIRDDNAEAIWLERASKDYRRYLSCRFRSLQSGTILQTTAQSLVALAGVATLGFGAMMVMQDALTIGSLIAVMAMIWRVLNPVQTVFLSINRLRQTLLTIRQIDHLIKLKPERPFCQMPAAGRRPRGAITLANASLRYGTRQELALRGLSLAVAAGEFVAITGSSGAGKSTLLKAILGLYPVQSGAVRLDERDLRQLDPIDVRQTIPFLPQEPSLFFGTVAQNVRLAEPGAPDEDVASALAKMGIAPDHPALSAGFDTRLGAENRQAMSPAFMQRIALARMFVRPSPILLFDEPGMHLDHEGDEAFMAAIRDIRGRCTIVMVTSRPSHMRLADRVVVLHEGQVAAQGKPEDVIPALMARAARPAA
jgi:ABC-type bacteriocin/lantibiotic exporter with double-glycine peptidase domain